MGAPKSALKRIMVTGGAVFAGSHVIDPLVKQKNCWQIIALDNFVRARRDNLAYTVAHGPVTLVESKDDSEATRQGRL